MKESGKTGKLVKLLESCSGNPVRSALHTFAPSCTLSLSKCLLSGRHLDLTWRHCYGKKGKDKHDTEGRALEVRSKYIYVKNQLALINLKVHTGISIEIYRHRNLSKRLWNSFIKWVTYNVSKDLNIIYVNLNRQTKISRAFSLSILDGQGFE